MLLNIVLIERYTCESFNELEAKGRLESGYFIRERQPI